MVNQMTRKYGLTCCVNGTFNGEKFRNAIRIYKKSLEAGFLDDFVCGWWRVPPQWKCGSDCYINADECHDLLLKYIVHGYGKDGIPVAIRLGDYFIEDIADREALATTFTCIKENEDYQEGDRVELYKFPGCADAFAQLDLDAVDGCGCRYVREYASDEVTDYATMRDNVKSWSMGPERTVNLEMTTKYYLDRTLKTPYRILITYYDKDLHEEVYGEAYSLEQYDDDDE